MSTLQTETTHPLALGIDQLAAPEILSILHDSQVAAAKSVRSAIPEIARGAEAMAGAIRDGGHIVYAAAGSSGLMGLADGLEIPPTFGVAVERIRILRAGGLEDMSHPKGAAEDDTASAKADAAGITSADCVICLAASGNTPYAVTIMGIANEVGATTVGLSNNKPAKLLTLADIPIHLPTPPEAIAGSTRLGAGSAQKIALNMMSTLMGIRLGHVMDGLMVNVLANNTKLHRRAENIVMQITGCERAVAAGNLKLSEGGVKEAILITSGANDLSQARNLLDSAGQNLRDALSRLNAG